MDISTLVDGENISINPMGTAKVGIGTCDPDAKLSVASHATGSVISMTAEGSNAYMKIGLAAEHAWIQSYGPRPLRINDLGNDVIFNTNGGNVGIGTAEPGAKLDVQQPEPLGDNPGNSKLLSRISGRANNWVSHSQWLVREAEGLPNWTNTRLHDAVTIDLISFVSPGVDTKTWWERDPYGNVQAWGNADDTYMSLVGGYLGIGTTEPDALLTVKGDIHTKEVRIDVEGAMIPDYVFEKDYTLLPLSELETYIKQNKHLPEVPSAKEMEAEGLNLKEMNLLLLKKVEELTLHLIEMKKEIHALKKEK
jgi:hypothetical protein